MQSQPAIPLQQIVAQPPATVAPHNAIIMPPDVTSFDEKQYGNLSEEAKKNLPWQYQGYPGLSEWMGSSNDFFVLRRFSRSAARTLLYLQNEIGTREKALHDWDVFAMKQPYGQGPSGNFQQDMFPQRLKLVQEMVPLLQKYYDLCNSFAEVKARPTAQDHHRRNLRNWFVTNPDAIVPSEQHLLNDEKEPVEGDLFPIIARPKTPLRWILHKSRILRFLFPSKKHSGHVQSPLARYHSDTAFDTMVCCVTVLIGLGMLFGPMWYLHYVDDVLKTLGVITGFVSLFAFWLWVAAGPRQFEILLGTAAYAAVVCIYLQAANDKDPKIPQ